MQVLATEKLHIEQIYSASYDDIMPNGNIYHCDCLANERLAIRKVDLFSRISIQMSRKKRTFVSHVYFILIEKIL